MEKCEVLIRFPNLTGEQRRHLYKAEDELGMAGVTFDTGVGCEGRDWEFDWSLHGADVLFKKISDGKEWIRDLGAEAQGHDISVCFDEIQQGLKEISEGKVVPLSELEKARLDRPDREKIDKILKSECKAGDGCPYNYDCELHDCFEIELNQILPLLPAGLDRPELRRELGKVLHKAVRKFELDGCPKAFDMKAHIDQLLSLIDPEAIRQEVAEEIREKIGGFTANAGAQKYKDDLLIYLFANPSNQDME